MPLLSTRGDTSDMLMQTSDTLYFDVLHALISMILCELFVPDFTEAKVLDSLQEPSPSKHVLLMQTAAHIPDVYLTPHFNLKTGNIFY